MPALTALLADGDPLLRGHAAWALNYIGNEEARAALATALSFETDVNVLREIREWNP